MIKFYLYIIFEYLNCLFFGKKDQEEITVKIRRKNDNSLSDNIVFLIHEWAGYPFVREKIIKRTQNKFTCGLKYSLERINSYIGKYKVEKILTISDCSD